MNKGIRRPEEVAGLGLSHRLLARVGALLKKQVAISATVLESARPGSPLEALLLQPALLERAAALDGEALVALSAKQAPPPPPLAISDASDGFRVLCLQEELDAADAWGSAPLATAAPHSLEISAASPSSGETLFAPAELERLKLKLVTASAASERAEALRVLTVAPLSAAEKADLLLHGLADPDNTVRAEAARLLPGLGADPAVAEALAGLNGADPARRLAAAERLAKLLSSGSPAGARELEAGAVVVCGLCVLKAEPDGVMAARLLDLLQSCAPLLGRNPVRLAEVMRVLSMLLAAAAQHGASSREVESLLTPAQRLVRALGQSVLDHLRPVLRAERERSTDAVTEAFYLMALLDFVSAGDAQEPELLALCAQYLARDKEEGRDSRAIGARLSRRGEPALRALCDVYAQANLGAQRHLLLVLDEICRLQKISPAALELAAGMLSHTLATGTTAQRIGAMQSRFATDPALPEPARRKLTEEFLNSASDFVFPTDIDRLEATLARMGLAALEPLLGRLGPDRPPRERVRAVRLLGETVLNMKAPPGELRRVEAGVTDVLRRLQALSLEPNFPDRGELLCALGKAAACQAVAREADEVITRTLLEGAQSDDFNVMPRVLEGLSFLAAARRAPAALVSQTATLLRGALDKANAEIESHAKTVNDETVFEVTGSEQYTLLLPIALAGLRRLICAESCPPTAARELGALLLERWQRICRAELIWGPANTLLLVQTLAAFACQARCSAELRLEIIKGFAQRHYQTPVMHALAEILAYDDSPATAAVAASIGAVMLSRRDGEGRFATEDRAEILKALGRLARRKLLGAPTPDGEQKGRTLRRTIIEELFKGLRDGVPYTYEALVSLRDAGTQPADFQADLDRRLKEYHSLAVR